MSEAGDLRLIHHHVGGRAGDTGFNLPKAFERDVVRVLYDADAGSIEHASERSAAEGRTTLVRPYFIGRPGATVRFNIAYCPYLSSARELARPFHRWYVEVDGADYVWGEANTPVKTVEVRSHGLDEITLGAAADLPPPDLLSIDTEGGEDDVLAGAALVLDRHVVAVIAEVKFTPTYVVGPLFGDISAMLGKHGFMFAEFDHLGRMSPLRGRLGTRGTGPVIFGDALFFKQPEAIAAGAGDRAGVLLRKLAFVAVCRGHFEFAQHCRDLCPPESMPAGEIPLYLRFVDQFQRICRSGPDIRPWTFNESYSEAASQARFNTLPPEESQRIWAEDRARAGREMDKIESMREPMLRAVSDPPLLRLFRRYGMDAQAKILLDTQNRAASHYVAGVAAKSGRTFTV
jgi:FkbM family methyltransferase